MIARLARRLPVLEHSYLARGARLLGGFVARRPIHAIIQVSNRCNLTCSFCSFWANPARPEHELTLADLQTLSDKLAEAGSLIVSIEGGEPLLRPDAVELVAAFARHHHPILFTNGWRVTAELARQLWDAGLDTVGVSIDYPDAARHDRHRGKPGTLDAARRALDLLRDSAPHGPRQVFVMSVLMRDNLDDFEALLQLSQAHGVGHQTTLVSTGGTMRQDSSATVPAPGAGARLLELKARYPHFISFSGYLAGIDTFLRGDVRTPCHAGERFLNIDHLGDVSPCIEKLSWVAGNLVREPYDVIAARLAAMEQTKTCADCWTSCRGFVEEMSGLPKLRSWREFFTDFSKGSAS
ncbi:MAG: radical SAM protein [Kofleriaceae bacterium]